MARRYTDEQFRDALRDPEVRTLADLCRALGLVPRGGNDASVRTYAADLDIDLDQHLAWRWLRTDPGRLADALVDCPSDLELLRRLDLPPGARRRLVERAVALGVTLPSQQRRRRAREGPRPFDEARVRRLVDGTRTRREVLAELGEAPTSHGYARLRSSLAAYGLDATSLRSGIRADRARRPLSELLVADRPVNSTSLRRRLIEEGLADHRCEGCGGTRWRGAAIPLELDHINGDRNDNRRCNLRLLCPNCHALTPTYRGRNVARRRRRPPP